MHINLDHAMAVLKAREDSLPWDLTIAIGGKDYPVRRPSSEDRAALSAITTQTPAASIRAPVRSMLQMPDEVQLSDEQLAGVAMTLLLALAELNKLRQEVLIKCIRAD